MDYKNINIDEIKIIPSIKDSYDIEYQGKQIYINSPILYIPFGIEKFYNAYSLNLQIRNCQEFENFIESLEKHLIIYPQKTLHFLGQLMDYANTRRQQPCIQRAPLYMFVELCFIIFTSKRKNLNTNIH